MDKYKITISGELGSGKSLLTSKLSTVLGFGIISVGLIQRKLAQKYNMSTLEFNKYMETHPEIDKECDDMVSNYGLVEESLILDSRLAWHFVNQAFKIHLLVDSNIAARRIYNDEIRKNEKYKSIDEAKSNIIERKNSERQRFKVQYNVDIDNFTNYDLVIDTTYASPEVVLKKVIEILNKWIKKDFFNKIYFSPKSLIPTQGIREHSFQYTRDISESIKKFGFEEDYPISIVKYLNRYFIFDGHKRASSAIENKVEIVPCELVGQDDEILPINQSIKDFITHNYKLKHVYDWEAMHQFNFPDYYPE